MHNSELYAYRKIGLQKPYSGRPLRVLYITKQIFVFGDTATWSFSLIFHTSLTVSIVLENMSTLKKFHLKIRSTTIPGSCKISRYISWFFSFFRTSETCFSRLTLTIQRTLICTCFTSGPKKCHFEWRDSAFFW